MKKYITSPVDTSKANWTRLQDQKIDRIIISLQITDFGIEDGCPWIEFPEEHLSKIKTPLMVSDDPVVNISLYDFRQRFAFEEKVAIESSTDPGVKVFLADLEAGAADGVNLKSETLAQGMTYLEDLSLIASGRKEEILAV